jgi:hypothetical protein
MNYSSFISDQFKLPFKNGMQLFLFDCCYFAAQIRKRKISFQGASESERDFGKRGQHTTHAVGIRNQGGVCMRAQANYRRPRCCSVACWLVTAEMSALFAHCSRGHRARTTGGPTAQNSASPSTRKNFTPPAVRERASGGERRAPAADAAAGALARPLTQGARTQQLLRIKFRTFKTHSQFHFSFYNKIWTNLTNFKVDERKPEKHC